MTDIELGDYVRGALAAGKTKETIYSELLAQGASLDAIGVAFQAPLAAQEKEESSARTIRTIVTIGISLIGVGIFSFIASNWQYMGKPTKIGIIMAAMIASYIGGWYYEQKGTMPKVSRALMYLGSIIYGSGIFLIAQMFNMRADWPDGFMLWMIGVIAMGFATEAYGFFVDAIILGAAALIGFPFSRGYDNFLLTSSLLLLCTTLVVFIAGYAIRKRMPRTE